MTTLDMIAVSVLVVGSDGRFVYANQDACHRLGYSQDELLTMSVHDIDPAFPPEAWASHWEELGRRGSFTVETTQRSKDGRLSPVEVTASLVEFDDQKFSFALFRDISDRLARQTQQEKIHQRLARRVRQQTTQLSAAEERYRLLFDGNNDAIFVHHPAADEFPGPFAEVNETACRWLGYTREELVGKKVEDVVTASSTDDMEAILSQLNRHGQFLFEVVLQTSSGQQIPAEMNSHLFDVAGRPTILTVARNITDRQRAEEDLRESEEKFRKLADEVSVDGIILHDQEIVLDVSLPFADMHGFRREELIGQYALGTIAPDCRERVTRYVREGHEETYEARDIRKDGSTFPVEVHVKNLMVQGRPIRAAVVRDMTIQRESERILREAEERYRTLFERAGDAIFILEAEGEQAGGIVDANQAAADMHGYTREELIGRNLAELDTELSPELIMERNRRIMDGEWIQAEVEHRKKNGELFPVEISAGCVTLGGRRFVLAFDRDASQRREAEEERRRLEARLRQAQKMEAIGTLAGGIAHDFNNILAAISGYTELVLLGTSASHDHARHLNEVLKGCQRAKALINQILTFSRVGEQVRRPVKVKQVAQEVLELMRASLPTTIDLTAELETDSMVLADPTQLHQMLMNLCTNAGQALARSGGWLKVSLRRTRLPSGGIVDGLAPGDYVSLEVADNGPGIDPAALDRIFDPFFTTKGPREGTGLGLSVVHGIAHSLGGTVSVDSRPGRGSVFRVLLPAIRPRGGEGQADRAPAPLTGSGHILFVDDEAALVDIGREMLSLLGYRVTATTSSPEALALFSKAPREFDLVIADQTMPKMTGCDLARQIKTVRPDVPVLLCTGFTDERLTSLAAALGINRVLLKPMSVRELGRAIHDVIHENSP